jgi:8-oxo-dGTP diphosphatase
VDEYQVRSCVAETATIHNASRRLALHKGGVCATSILKPYNLYMKLTCALTADSVLIVDQEVLLVQRKHEPFQGHWCFPGGFIEQDEKIIDGARRELQEETGIEGVNLVQFGTYGDPGRDPRGRTVSVVFLGFPESKPPAKAADDAAAFGWFPIDQPPNMAFDHGKILIDVQQRLKNR